MARAVMEPFSIQLSALLSVSSNFSSLYPAREGMEETEGVQDADTSLHLQFLSESTQITN